MGLPVLLYGTANLTLWDGQSYLWDVTATDRLCCSLPTSSTHTGQGVWPSALDTLRVLVVTGSKVILDLLLAKDNIQQVCQLLSRGNRGNILTHVDPSNQVSSKISFTSPNSMFVCFSTPEIRTPH